MPTLDGYVSEERGIFAMFKGDSGAGKSVAALSFPNCYVFDHDRKMPGIALKHYSGRKDIAWDTFDDIFLLQRKIEEFLTVGCPYETIISDSLTHLVNNVFKSVGDMKNETPIKLIENMKLKGQSQMTIDYYNAETNFIQRYWINALKTLWIRKGNPKNVIQIAHIITTESSPDLKTKAVTTTRGIVTAGKKVGAYVPTEFDDMWHFGYESNFEPGKPNSRVCFFNAIGEDSAKTTLKVPSKLDWTDKNFYDEIQKWTKGDISI